MVPTNYMRLFMAESYRSEARVVDGKRLAVEVRIGPFLVDSFGDKWELRQWHVQAGHLEHFGHLCSPENKAIHGEWIPVPAPLE